MSNRSAHDKLQSRMDAEKAKERPADYFKLSASDQWEIDKRLGILDWDGNCGGAGCDYSRCEDCGGKGKKDA